MARIDDVVSEFVAGYERQKAKASSVTVRENKIFSYGTVIAEFVGSNDLLLNSTKYSMTTTRLQNKIKRVSEQLNVNIFEVTEVPMSTNKLSN